MRRFGMAILAMGSLMGFDPVHASEMTVGFVQPRSGATVGSDLDVVIAVDAASPVKLVIAEIANLSFVLTRDESAYGCDQPVTHFPEIRCDHPERLPGWTGSFDLRSLRSGKQTLMVTVTDSEGNTTQSEIDLNYLPTSSIQAPSTSKK